MSQNKLGQGNFKTRSPPSGPLQDYYFFDLSQILKQKTLKPLND